MCGSEGKGEEGVAGGTGRGERCFPNGSHLMLVCGRVEDNPESPLLLFFLSFIPFFNPPLDAARGGYGDPVRSAPSASCPLGRVSTMEVLVVDGMCGYGAPFFPLLPLTPSYISPSSSQPPSNCVICARLPRFGGWGSLPRTRSFSQSSRWRKNRFS